MKNYDFMWDFREFRGICVDYLVLIQCFLVLFGAESVLFGSDSMLFGADSVLFGADWRFLLLFSKSINNN
jgi:hypothetical protein